MRWGGAGRWCLEKGRIWRGKGRGRILRGEREGGRGGRGEEGERVGEPEKKGSRRGGWGRRVGHMGEAKMRLCQVVMYM